MVKDSNILILGITFKENCPDVRNTKVCDIYTTLAEYTSNIMVYDPWADSNIVKKEYGIEIANELPQTKFDAVILAVAHKEFAELDIKALLNEVAVVYDVKGVLDRGVIDARLEL